MSGIIKCNKISSVTDWLKSKSAQDFFLHVQAKQNKNMRFEKPGGRRKNVWRGKSISRTASMHEGLGQKLGDHDCWFFDELETFLSLEQLFNYEKFLTELKRLRGRLEAVRCSLESGIDICGAQCRCDPQPSAEGVTIALDGGLRGPRQLAPTTTWGPLAWVDLGLFLDVPWGSPGSALYPGPFSTEGNFMLKFFINFTMYVNFVMSFDYVVLRLSWMVGTKFLPRRLHGGERGHSAWALFTRSPYDSSTTP